MTGELDKLLSIVKDGQTQKIILPKEELQIISFALNYAKTKHANQRRKNGKPYIDHPIAVAKTLIQYNADYITISAGLLHDVVEEQINEYKETHSDSSEEELNNLESRLVVALQEDIFGSFAETLKIKSNHELVQECAKQILEVQNECKKRLQEDLGVILYAELKKPIELRKDTAQIMSAMEKKLLREEKRLEREVPRQVKILLNKKYSDLDLLESTIHYTHDLGIIVDVVKLMTREEGTSFSKAIDNIFDETDEAKKVRAIQTKMADMQDNITDMLESTSTHTNSNRLYRCFKNMYVLNRVKNYFSLTETDWEEPLCKLFVETCGLTHYALANIAEGIRMQLGKDAWKLDWQKAEYEKRKKGLSKVTKTNELDSIFDGRIGKYLYAMLGHKESLEEMHKDPFNQYIDSIAFKSIIENLAMDNTFIITNLLRTPISQEKKEKI